MTVKDHFSRQSAAYASFRPTYPAALFDWLAAQSADRGMAWDCGCGSGQATVDLAGRFRWVIATDPSAAQLERAPHLANVEYRCAPAEASGLPDRSVDLVCVAQALHWFDLERFYAEVRRVLRPGGALAAFGYGLLRIAPELDAVIDRFYHDEIGPYWPPERRHVDDAYRSLAFPFAELAVPALAMTAEWSFDHLLGYLESWSAVQAYRRTHDRDPLEPLAEPLRVAWGDQPVRTVSWPLFCRAGRVV